MSNKKLNKMKDQKKYSHTTSYILLATLFLAAFLERAVWDLGPNVELITTAMILASIYVGRKEAFWLTLAIMTTTDALLGNTNIFIFTWSGFLIPAIFAGKIFADKKFGQFKKIVLGTSAGIGSNLFFFLWTNFGVWLIGNMYTKNLTGLLMSYFYGLPFVKPQIISSLIFIPLGMAGIQASLKLYRKWRIHNFESPAIS